LSLGKKAGFYGLDIYSLWESMEAIINYLRKVDPSALPVAERAFECFAPYQREEGSGYSYASAMVPEPCTQEVVNLLTEIQRRAPRYNSDPENVFSAEQNAIISVNAEKYYRAMLEGGATTWNIRDNHMMETLDRLLSFYGPGAKTIVWAHNTHIGDARATDMKFQGMHNLGELARKKYGEKDVFLVGFGSFEGSVIAASVWGDGMQRMPLPPAIPESWENILKETGTLDGYLLLKEFRKGGVLDFEIGHRAIGVVYNPSSENRNYVPSRLPFRYDAFVFLRQTKGLHPLSIAQDKRQMPETYPFGV
jgi:erythromycin esterase-like protein